MIVVRYGCASKNDENHQFFVNHILPIIGMVATAIEVVDVPGWSTEAGTLYAGRIDHRHARPCLPHT
jgi:hypothetical protein